MLHDIRKPPGGSTNDGLVSVDNWLMQTMNGRKLSESKLGLFLTALLIYLAPPLTSCAQTKTNVPPTVGIISPLDGEVSYTTNSLIIEVEAGDTDGTVTQVSLLRDGVLLASANTPPYEFELINLTEGTNVYTASATDD
jgi:hypothetical protein